jgi:hypothetical protein
VVSITILSSVTWAGGGNGHYYGTLWSRDPIKSVEVEMELDEPAARAMNWSIRHIPKYTRYVKGQITHRILGEDNLILAARRMLPEHFPGTTVLINGENYINEPQEVVMGPGKRFVEAANKYWRIVEESYNGTGPTCIEKGRARDKATKQWERLFERRGLKPYG